MILRPRAESRPQSLAIKYVLVLGSLAVLAVGGQALLQLSLAHQKADILVVSQAGRQIHSCLEVAALAQSILKNPDPATLERTLPQLRTEAVAFSRDHRLLAETVNNDVSSSRLAALEPQLVAMDRAIDRLESARAAAADSFNSVAVAASAGIVQGIQPIYRVAMEDMIRVFSGQSETRLEASRRAQLALLALALVVLLLQGLFIFRPAVRETRSNTLRLEQAEARLRLQRDMLVRISEHEQQKMGRDLHDRLGQQLTGIAFMASLLHQKLRDGPYAQDAQEITQLLQTTVRQTRDLARALFPAQIHEDGFVPSLQALAVSTSGQFDVDCQVRAPANIYIADQTTSTNLFRIVQEAVNNAARHGGGSAITITADSRPDSLQLSVHDDGPGFTPSSPGEDTMGLAIMRERSEMIGAQLEIKSQSQEGTTILCTVPHAAQDKETNEAHV